MLKRKRYNEIIVINFKTARINIDNKNQFIVNKVIINGEIKELKGYRWIE